MNKTPHTITIRVSPFAKQWLQRAANERGTTVSRVVKDAIKQAIVPSAAKTESTKT